MGKLYKINRAAWTIGSVVALFICYLICRFVFYGLHGMKDWPFVLLVLGETVIAIAAFTDSRTAMGCAAADYGVGFIAGMLFSGYGYRDYGSNVDGEFVVEYRALVDNGWLIWTAVYLTVILAGIIGEIVGRHQKKRK